MNKKVVLIGKDLKKMSEVKEIQIKAYQCECGKTYNDKYVAEICCKQYHCETCGAETKKYWLMCDPCREKRDFDKAKKITIEEYEKEYSGNMVYYNDNYYTDIDDMLDSLCCHDVDILPSYCWGTDKVPVEIDAISVLDELLENSNCEDIDFSKEAYQEFKDFAEQWNKKWSQYYYMMNDIVILIPEEVLKEYQEDN
jgi:hypothetical protein